MIYPSVALGLIKSELPTNLPQITFVYDDTALNMDNKSVAFSLRKKSHGAISCVTCYYAFYCTPNVFGTKPWQGLATTIVGSWSNLCWGNCTTAKFDGTI